jgi:hypothetical protein
MPCGCGEHEGGHEGMRDGRDGHDGLGDRLGERSVFVENNPNCGIPSDPAFPAQNFVGLGHHGRRGVLVPVVLDLHGNIANGKNFSTGPWKVPGTGLPYSNRSVLYYNNKGTFVLSRNWRRRSDFA